MTLNGVIALTAATTVERLQSSSGGRMFLRYKPLCFRSRPVPEVDTAEAETGSYSMCDYRRASLEISVSI